MNNIVYPIFFKKRSKMHCKNKISRKSIQLLLIVSFLCFSAGLYFFYPTEVDAQVSNASTQAVASKDKYTQSQAHMSLPAIKNLIEKTYSIKAYAPIIAAALAKEETYKDDFYVFYHGMDNVWRVPQDLYTQLYAHFYPAILDPSIKDFIFLRFGSHYPTIKPQDFLLTELKRSGLINDHGTMGELLLAVNLALFGNVGTPSECSWEYFIKSRGHTNPDRKIYELIMDRFSLTHKYIDELMSLVELYRTKEETLLQVFVPKNLIDVIGYLAWIRGNPASEEIMEWVLASVRSKRFPKTQQSLDALTRMFKNEQEKNPLFNDLIGQVKAGAFALSSFLHTYRNNPEQIKNINMFMARLIFTSEVLLNPKSGIKFFRFSTATSEQLKTYHDRLTHIIQKILSEK